MRPRVISGANSARAPAAGARLRTNALLCIERRRARLQSGAGRFLRPRSRYEDLWLALALAEAEWRCLASTEPRRLPEIDRANIAIAGVGLRIEEGQLSLARAARWLSPSARGRANERGKRRLQEIAVAVKAENCNRGAGPPGCACCRRDDGRMLHFPHKGGISLQESSGHGWTLRGSHPYRRGGHDLRIRRAGHPGLRRSSRADARSAAGRDAHPTRAAPHRASHQLHIGRHPRLAGPIRHALASNRQRHGAPRRSGL